MTHFPEGLAVNCEADFRYMTNIIVQFIYFVIPKFPASSHHLCFCCPVNVRLVGKPHYWFSHDAAHIFNFI